MIEVTSQYANTRNIVFIILALIASGCTTAGLNQTDLPTIHIPEQAPCSNKSLSAEQVFAVAKDGVVVIETPSGQGSGFVVAHQNGSTLLITNAHVVDGESNIQVKWVDGKTESALVIAQADGTSPITDLALLKLEGLRGTPLQLSQKQAKVGEELFVIGTPKGLEFSLSRGVLSGLRENKQILQVDAAINPGNSGGPVLDASSCVVGVATFKLRDSEGLNFSVASQVVRRFLANPPSVSIATAPEDPGKPAFPPTTTPSSPSPATGGSDPLDDITDEIFWRRHPELRGKIIKPGQTALAAEWAEIRRCDAVVDQAFYEKVPAMRGRTIDPADREMVELWKQIRSEVSSCG